MKKNIPKIRELDGNEKIHSPILGTQLLRCINLNGVPSLANLFHLCFCCFLVTVKSRAVQYMPLVVSPDSKILHLEVWCDEGWWMLRQSEKLVKDKQAHMQDTVLVWKYVFLPLTSTDNGKF